MSEPAPLPASAIIGILGGGQLGRMLALAAARLGVRTHFFCPDPESPAFAVTDRKSCAAYDDETALAAFADAVDCVTYEFENVPAATADFLAARTLLRPGAGALAVAQDRLIEKRFLTGIGVAVAPFAPVTDPDDLPAALAAIGTPAILKTARLGYDGKGQRRIDHDGQAAPAFAELGSVPCVLEAFVPFACEVSAIVARHRSGASAAWDIAENTHKNHILDTSRVPASIPDALQAEAKTIATAIADALDYAGVLAVEFFVTGGPQPRLLVNEIAPRVHNSGHWTQDAAITDQFEQHIRAILGWPLGDAARHAEVEMRNLIGDDIADAFAPLPAGASAHVYGKTETRPGRKMGHINLIRPLKSANPASDA